LHKQGRGDGNNLYSGKLAGDESWSEFKAPADRDIET
jgi:hypothetical protein